MGAMLYFAYHNALRGAIHVLLPDTALSVSLNDGIACAWQAACFIDFFYWQEASLEGLLIANMHKVC